MERHNEEEKEMESVGLCVCRNCAILGAQQEGRKLVNTFIFRSDENQVCDAYDAAIAT